MEGVDGGDLLALSENPNKEVLELPADAWLELVTCSAAPGSETEPALAELAAWASARDRVSMEAVKDR